jgi:hypothetical protein
MGAVVVDNRITSHQEKPAAQLQGIPELVELALELEEHHLQDVFGCVGIGDASPDELIQPCREFVPNLVNLRTH